MHFILLSNIPTQDVAAGSLGEDLTTTDELLTALRYAGFNPGRGCLARHWPPATASLSFQQFAAVAELEPLPTEASLLSTFQLLDPGGTGSLSHDSLQTSLRHIPVQPATLLRCLLAISQLREVTEVWQ